MKHGWFRECKGSDTVVLNRSRREGESIVPTAPITDGQSSLPIESAGGGVLIAVRAVVVRPLTSHAYKSRDGAICRVFTGWHITKREAP